jgi:hypothetical protein
MFGGTITSGATIMVHQMTYEVQRNYNETRSKSGFGAIKHDQLGPAGLPTRQHEMHNGMGISPVYARTSENDNI